MLFFSLPRAALLALLLSSVFALQLPNVYSRQEPGSPNYECHMDCGLVTRYWHQGGDYCDTADFKTRLSNCLKCALTQDIWQWYGEDVKNAANKCHVDATPSPSSSQGSSPTTATNSGGSTSSLSTATGANSSSQTDASATTTATTGESTSSLGSTTGATSSSHMVTSATATSSTGEKVFESASKTSLSETGKFDTTTATACESSSAKTTAEHTSTLATACGTPQCSESVTPSVTSHVSSSVKGLHPTTSSDVPPVFNAASPIQQNAITAAFLGVLAWALAA